MRFSSHLAVHGYNPRYAIFFSIAWLSFPHVRALSWDSPISRNNQCPLKRSAVRGWNEKNQLQKGSILSLLVGYLYLSIILILETHFKNQGILLVIAYLSSFFYFIFQSTASSGLLGSCKGPSRADPFGFTLQINCEFTLHSRIW